MRHAFEEYATRLKLSLKLDPSSRDEVVRELETHLEDRKQELAQEGLTREEAESRAVLLFGPVEDVARRFYSIHSRDTWKHALLAALPHTLFGLLFALHWWQNAVWTAFVLLAIVGLAFYGWRRKGKPVWLFPWLGYSLLPVICAGILLLFIPRGWSWIAIFLYIPLALRVAITIVLQTARTDWLYGSLMLLPFPIGAAWLIAISRSVSLWDIDREKLVDISPWIGLSFLGLAVIVISFIRLSGRWLKIGALFTPEIVIVMLVALFAGEGLNPLWVIATLVLTLSILCSPLLLEQRGRKGETTGNPLSSLAEEGRQAHQSS